ncbi:MAG: MG2 domain-containing protein [Bacteroidales bacterium]|nr:MG2 domain-containing protein [Bacteroidales bacterium]
MKKTALIAVGVLGIIAVLLSIVLSKWNSNTSFVEPVYNEHVAAYTSGIISRKSNVYIIFSQDLSQGRIDSLKAEQVMTISPKVEGKYYFSDTHTLVFTPTKEMERNTVYTVEVDIKSIFHEGEKFTYSYTTKPFAVNGCLTAFDVTDDDQYELTFAFNTADIESAATVEKHIGLSAECTNTWSHPADGKTHILKALLKGGKEQTLAVTTKADKELNLEENTIISTVIPSSETLSVFEVKYKSGDSKYIEVTFNKNLDPKQKMRGLAYIMGNQSEAVDMVEGNKLKLYPDANAHDEISVFISKAIKSRSGLTLNDDKIFMVTVKEAKPEVRFVGNGTIIPQSDKILVPFQAIYMKGIRVKVFKIFSNMIGTMLQKGDIDSYNELKYAARPIAATTFYLDEYGYDLSQFHTYAIDLTDRVQLEPGAMYRIEMSLDARLSAWESDSLPTTTKEEMEAEDRLMLTQICNEFDRGGWYYTGQTYDNGDYDWWIDNFYELKKDPASKYFYSDKAIGKNVLATNIGLTAIKGTDNILRVTALDIPEAKPIGGVNIEVYSMQQQLIGKGNTNGDGIAEITIDEKLGQPLYIMATKGSDVSYLRVKRGEELSTSSFDVSGDIIQNGLKGYIYGDRGVWRPGDTLHISFMLNDKNKSLPQDHPVTLQVTNPLGQLYQKLTKTAGVMGTYAFNIPIDNDAPTGSWTAQVNIGNVSFSKSLRIETIKPNRLKIDLDLPKVINGYTPAKLHTEWLHGGVASRLKYDISTTIVETKTGWSSLKGYVFDNITKSYETSEQELAKGEVGDNGNATFTLNPQVSNTAPGMLKCNVVTHVYEPSGEFSSDVMQTLVSPYSRYIGIKSPLKNDEAYLETEKKHSFDVISVDKDGNTVGDVNMEAKIFKVEWYWWWRSNKEEMAGYTSSRYHTPYKTLKLQTGADGKGHFEMQIDEEDWGTYLIEVRDLNGEHSTAILSYFDWPGMTRRNESGSEAATMLTITTDKNEYKPGDKMHISIPSSQGSRAIVSVSNGSKTLVFNNYECKQGNTEICLDVTEEMMPNVFVGVSLVQQYGKNINDMPIRMYGFVPVTVTSEKSRLNPIINCNDEIRPEAKCTVTVGEKDGRPMAYTLAIVDEGLLDLTHFKTPNAWDAFNAREAMGIRMWDLYGHINGAYGGRIEQMFSIGGDEALNNGPKAIVNRFTPMVYFSGPYMLKKGQKNSHNINVPNYNGRVRVMVVAGDGEAYGNAEKSVLVRRPLMLIGTMPRQIGANDEMTVSATVFASKKLGNVTVGIKASNGLEIIGNNTSNVTFNEAGDQTIMFKVRAGKCNGLGNVTITAESSDDKIDYSANIEIRSVSQKISKSTLEKIDAGKEWNGKVTMPGDGDYNIKIEASSNKPLNIASRLASLIGYPHGCVEQTTSKVFPQLYLNDFTELTEAQQSKIENNIKAGIDRLRSFQTSEGGMAYWQGSNVSNVWASAYVMHFLTEASAKGYYVPEEMFKRLKNYVSGIAKNWRTSAYHQEITDACYCIYVLANAQATELGAMNRMKEQIANLNKVDLYMLSASYALAGRNEIAKELLANSGNNEYYSWFSADIMKLIAQTTCDDSGAADVSEVIRKRLMSDNWMSTSETSYSLVAMSKYYKKNAASEGLKFSASIDGKQISNVNSSKYSWTTDIEQSSNSATVSIKNKGNAVMYANITAEGIATQSHVDSNNNGLEIGVRYANIDGSALNVTELPQSTTFKAYVTIRNTSGKKLEHVAITHILPAGWEILSFDQSNNVDFFDQRDDRMLSYKDKMDNGQTITIAMNISATYAGRYYMPAITAEAMYDATISGCNESGECIVK